MPQNNYHSDWYYPSGNHYGRIVEHRDPEPTPAQTGDPPTLSEALQDLPDVNIVDEFDDYRPEWDVYFDEQEARQAERARAEQIAEAQAPQLPVNIDDDWSGWDRATRLPPATARRPASPIRRNQCGINKTQLRELQAHSHVWQWMPSNLRVRVNNAVASDGRLFRLTNQERDQIRAAIHRARGARPVSDRLNDLYLNVLRWS